MKGWMKCMKSHRRLTALCLTVALTASMAITASADSPVTVSVNGVDTAVPAYVNSDWRTMVPGKIADSLGLTYSQSSNSITFTGNGNSKTYTVGTAVGNTAPQLVDGEIYIPFYDLAETFGYTVKWDAAASVASAHKDQAIDLNSYLLANTEKTNDTTRALPIDRTEVNEHPVVGYYNYTLDTGRTIKLYIP